MRGSLLNVGTNGPKCSDREAGRANRRAPSAGPNIIGMNRWVLLRHDLSDGSWHYDWMLSAGSGRPDEPLVTFRLVHRPDDPGTIRFDAERIGDHRRDYLTFEGPLSGGRGWVRREASGTCTVHRDDHVFGVELIELGVAWAGTRAAFESAWYRFERVEAPEV